MAAIADTPVARQRMERLERIWREPGGVLGWLRTTDHKRIGLMYLVATLVFFAAGGAEALLVRTQLMGPDLHVLSPKAYDQALAGVNDAASKSGVNGTPTVFVNGKLVGKGGTVPTLQQSDAAIQTALSQAKSTAAPPPTPSAGR